MNELKIKRLLEDYQKFHSDFQIENFIVKSQGDDWAQYKQCLREIKARLESISDDKTALGVLLVDLRKRRFFLPTKSNREKNKNRKKLKFKQIERLKKVISERERELKKFVEIATRLKEKIGSINEAKRQRLETKSWMDKARRMFLIDKITYGAPRQQTIEFILNLPTSSQDELFEKLGFDFGKKLLALDIREKIN